MYTISELEQLKMRVNSGLSNSALSKQEALNLIDQTLKTQITIQNFIEFMSLMARKGSSWGPQIREKLNEYLFDGADEATIDAAMALLEKHRNVTVDNLLRMLRVKTTPGIDSNNNARIIPVTRSR